MDATMYLIAVVAGVALGGASSVVTRKLGMWPGVAFAAVFVIAGLALSTVLDLGVVLSAMLAFAVTASLFDPRSEKTLAT